MSGVFSYGRGSSLVWAERLEFPRPPGQQILRQLSCAMLEYDKLLFSRGSGIGEPTRSTLGYARIFALLLTPRLPGTGRWCGRRREGERARGERRADLDFPMYVDYVEPSAV